MPEFKEPVSIGYKLYGARGVQAVVLGYLLFRYSRAIVDKRFAPTLLTSECQNCWMVPVPYYIVTLLTPIIVVGLEMWASRQVEKPFFLSRYLEWPLVGWTTICAALFYFWVEVRWVLHWRADLPLYDDEWGVKPTLAVGIPYTLVCLAALFWLARLGSKRKTLSTVASSLSGPVVGDDGSG